MKTTIHLALRGIVAVLVIMTLIGCAAPQTAAPSPIVQRNDMSTTSLQQPTSKAPSAVQSAIELSQKCAELSEQLANLKEKNLILNTENDSLKAHIEKIEPELEQAQKELQEANDLLIEMRLDLNNWKENVLGYRTEMREANQAQLEALIKILQLLGGEIMLETPEDQNAPAN